MRLAIAAVGVVALVAGACDFESPSAPQEGVRGRSAALTCVASVATRSVTCDGGTASMRGGLAAIIVGGQDTYVRLESDAVTFTAGDSIFQADVSVTNLLAQDFGMNAEYEDTGIRVFFQDAPVVVDGTGSVEIVNPDGYDTFTTGGQAFFEYAGGLFPGDASEWKTWRFRLDEGVQTFSFGVYVQADIPHESSVLRFTQVHSSETGPYISLWGASSSSVFAVGYYGVIARLVGGTWVDDVSPVDADFEEVWGSSATDVFAVGSGGVIVHWDGSAWTEMDSGVTGECGCAGLLSVWGSGPNDVWAGGVDGVLTHYDGNGWVASDTLPTEEIVALWGTSSSNVFAAGGDQIFHFDGSVWTQMVSGIEESGDFILSMWGASGSDVYIAYTSGILRYDGTAWTDWEEAQTCIHFDVWGTSASDLFVLNICGAEHFDGTSWAYLDPGEPGMGGFALDVWGSGPHDVYMNTDGFIYRGTR